MRRTVTAVLTAILTLSVLPASANDFHIVNGSPAAPGEFPSQAAILELNPDFQFCGGTLIHPQWILTAAHCFYDGRTGESRIPASAVEVTLNRTNWTDPSQGERIAVSQIVIHPDYNDLGSPVNDVTLLRLASPATTPPAPLVAPDGQALYTPGRPAVATGYGTIFAGGPPSEDLLKVDLSLVSDDSCRGSYPDLADDRHTCAADPGTNQDPGNDTCQGDSGGPLWTDRGDGVLAQIGITSFGFGCGGPDAGVYAEVITYLGWLNGIIDGTIPINDPDDPTTPDLPEGSAAEPIRITYDASGVSDPVLQAVAMSRVTFLEEGADFAVIATSTRFPDALGGSTLAYGVAPLLFTGGDGSLNGPTITELQRAVIPGSPIYVLGGTAAIPASTDQQLRDAGFEPFRLAGAGREATAVEVATAALARFENELPLDTVIVSTGSNWPDAVGVGQIGSYWGVPILLTPTGQSLNAETAAFLSLYTPGTVLVPGGQAALADSIVAEIEAITGPGSVIRLAGATRFGTASAVTEYNLSELFNGFAPPYIVVANLRREPDAFAHVLASSMLTGGNTGVMVGVEGDTGTTVTQDTLDAICGLDARVVAAGATDLISDEAVRAIQLASGGVGCEAVGEIELGDLVESSITTALNERVYAFQGVAGQAVQIRMDAPGFGFDSLDPKVKLLGPDGAVVAENDDGLDTSFPSFNSLIETTLPVTGTYRIVASRFGETTGPFILTLDAAALGVNYDTLTAETSGHLYHVEGPAGLRVVVEMRADDRNIDPVAFAIDPVTGDEVGYSDDGGGFPNARLEFVMPASGQVDIVATVFDTFYGAYSVWFIEPTGQLTFG